MPAKIKISQKELDNLYEVEEDLTQPKIEDNIDNKPEFLTEAEEALDIEMHGEEKEVIEE